MSRLLYGQYAGRHRLGRWIDHAETYGPHIVERFVASLPDVRTAVDLGAGQGRDLRIIKERFPAARTIGIEASEVQIGALSGAVDEAIRLNLERDRLPFDPESVDLVVANQILEHTKEVFWIFDQVTRCLKIGGHFLIGVPNVASLHNRLLLLVGEHPTQSKLCSAHVRPFSKKDTMRFLEACFPSGYRLEAFAGSQFYPLPGRAARFMADHVPSMAFSIFFLLRKEKPYAGEFAAYPARADLETNFWRGE